MTSPAITHPPQTTTHRGKPSSTRVAWLTNQTAPYRLPVWAAMARAVRLDVRHLEMNRRFARDTRNRGLDWAAQTTSGYTVTEVKTWRLTRGESTYFIALTLPFRVFKHPEALLIGGWESPAYWQALLLGRLTRTRLVGFYESTLASQGYSKGPIARARNFFFQRLDMVVVPGISAREAVKNMGVASDRIAVGFNSVDVVRIHRQAQEFRAGAAQELAAAAPNGHRFLFVGQLIARKRPLALLQAFGEMCGPHDSLTILGMGNLEKEFRQEIERLALSDSVTMVASVPNDEIGTFMAEYDTLVLPSATEVWGLVANEALAAGLHVVVTISCGVAASIDGMAGVFVSSQTQVDLASQMARSRDAWAGPIASPAILAHTPEAFADIFLRALVVPR